MTELPPTKTGVRRWRFVVSQGSPPNRVRHTRVHQGQNVRAAQAALRQFVADLEQRAPTSSSAPTLGELLERWRAHCVTIGRAATTMESVRLVTNLRLAPIAHWRIDQITPADLDRLYHAILAEGRAPATVRQVHAIIRRSLRQAVLWGLIDNNPAERVQPPSLGQHEIVPPSTADVRRLLEVADRTDPLIGLYLRLAATTGARRAELCGLKWSDLDGATVTVRRTVSAIRGIHAEAPTKTRSVRQIVLPPDMVAGLERRRRFVRAQCMQVRTAIDDGWWVFPLGEPWAVRPWPPDGASARFARVRTAAGVTMRLHDLRHWSATTLLDAGVSLVSVAARLGHADGTTTMKVYGHRTQRADEESAEIMAKMLG